MEKMVVVGLIWGVTNAVMGRGAKIWDRKLKSNETMRNCGRLVQWIYLLQTWQYSVPFLINLSASAAFFHILGEAPISVAVPVTNGSTFAATAVTAAILGEKTRVGVSVAGTLLIILGVWLCVSSSW